MFAWLVCFQVLEKLLIIILVYFYFYFCCYKCALWCLQVELESVKIEYSNAQLECNAADERAKLLAAEVIGLEEKVVKFIGMFKFLCYISWRKYQSIRYLLKEKM